MKLAQSPNINQLWANLMVEEFLRNGVNYFCISPGSRSSPLTVAVAQNPKTTSFVHFDERGAAFHALGFTSATKRPSVLISTSGTAGANYFPAIIEASKKKLPLIVLTADRPPELRWTGADQTIDQVKMYGDYVRWHFDMPCPTKDISPNMVLTTIGQAVHRSKGSPVGPVHINCMYREPLAPTKTQANFSFYLKDLKDWQVGHDPLTAYVSPTTLFPATKLQQVVKAFRKIHQGVIVVGKLNGEAEQEAVLKLSKRINWPIFPDVTSGLRTKSKTANCVAHYDQLLISDKFQKGFKPDGVLHLGGRITSKRWYQFIDEQELHQYVMVNKHPLRNDPLHNVTLRIESDIDSFCKAMNKSECPRRPGKEIPKLQTASEKVTQCLDRFLEKDQSLNEPAVARIISNTIPEGHGLFLSSSMPIRDFDMYANADKNIVHIGANRGASGIDGTIATAVGFAVGLNKPTTLVVGDLAFLHDLNSLSMVPSVHKPFVIVVINNNGGGIFSLLPIAKHSDVFDQYFGTPHNLTFESASKQFGLAYANPKSKQDFTQVYAKAIKQSLPTVIEVTSDRAVNADVHKAITKDVRSTINKFYT